MCLLQMLRSFFENSSKKSYFTIAELCKSDTAKKLGIVNTPTEEVIDNLHALIDNILDPLRIAYGKPIYVNSGYRCPILNKAVGGVKTSNHQYGYAADITAGSVAENRKLWKIFLDLHIPFTELIDEKNMTWIHISYDPNNLMCRVTMID